MWPPTAHLNACRIGLDLRRLHSHCKCPVHLPTCKRRSRRIVSTLCVARNILHSDSRSRHHGSRLIGNNTAICPLNLRQCSRACRQKRNKVSIVIRYALFACHFERRDAFDAGANSRKASLTNLIDFLQDFQLARLSAIRDTVMGYGAAITTAEANTFPAVPACSRPIAMCCQWKVTEFISRGRTERI